MGARSRGVPATRKQTVLQRVTEYMRARIADGTWVVGEKIPSENTLIEETGVSRVSIRLAIRQFAALGVMRSVQGKGTYLVRDCVVPLERGRHVISQEDCEDIATVLEFRGIVEPEACFLAAGHATEEMVGELRGLVAGLRGSVGDLDAYFDNDWAFHMAVAEMSGNRLLAKSLLTVFDHAREEFRRLIAMYKFKGGGIYYHELILDAFEKRDPRLARAIMREHLETAYQQIVAINASLQ